MPRVKLKLCAIGGKAAESESASLAFSVPATRAEQQALEARVVRHAKILAGERPIVHFSTPGDPAVALPLARVCEGAEDELVALVVVDVAREAPGVAAAPTAPSSAAALNVPVRGHGGRDQARFMEMAATDAGAVGAAISAANLPKVAWDQVQQHQSVDDCWIVFDGMVYDITKYLNYHPGGKKILLRAAGTDCTSLFNRYHPWVNAHHILKSYLKGRITGRCPATIYEGDGG